VTGYLRPWRRPARAAAQPGFRQPPGERCAYGRDGADAGVYAALDLGTNNCRLLVARPRAGGFRVIDAFSRIVRLGEGLAQTEELGEHAMRRTIDALRVCASKIRKRRVTHARHVATEACRRARNCQDFVARVHAETGIELEIISSREEAELALAGCAPLLDPAKPYALVFDIGGGSTELLWLQVGADRAARLIDWMSLPYGVVGLAESQAGLATLEAWYDAVADEIATLLAPFEARHAIARKIADGTVQMLGSSGTVTTLAGVHFGLARYDRSYVDGSYLDFADIDRVSRRLAAMDGDGRAAEPCIGRERADLVVGGCAILAAICRTWPVGSLRVADRGVREGILVGLMRAQAVR
jgi:exopolyphosphatase/guanosine-5'-triphosphate,3'-diphosphate pyrophosphatase